MHNYGGYSLLSAYSLHSEDLSTKKATLHIPVLKAFVIQSTDMDAAVFGVANKQDKLKPKQESNKHTNIPGE